MLMISKLTLPYSRCRFWMRAHTYSTLLHTLAVCHKLYISTYIQYVHLIAWPFHNLHTYVYITFEDIVLQFQKYHCKYSHT